MKYIRKNLDIIIAALLATAVLLYAPFNLNYYVDCINIPLLIKLFCLMYVVAGMRQYGLLNRFWKSLLPKDVTTRKIGRFFIFICFFSSMFITNDVALIIFVPLAIEVLSRVSLERHIIFVVVWQTIAANMGSMLTPMGNPQNLFIYEQYNLDLSEFLLITAPITVCCGILIYLVTFCLPDSHITMPEVKYAHLSKRILLLLTSLFLMCILCVLRIVSPQLLAITVIFFLNFLKGHLFLKVDFKLLVLFMLLFIVVGGLANIPQMQNWPRTILENNVYLTTLGTCQIISNVPAAVMLSGFTADYKNLLLGVSIGGLGTLIASMASLISFKAYTKVQGANVIRYLCEFSLANVLLLTVLSVMKYVIDAV